jgi:hypothetical protein
VNKSDADLIAFDSSQSNYRQHYYQEQALFEDGFKEYGSDKIILGTDTNNERVAHIRVVGRGSIRDVLLAPKDIG